MSALAIQLHCPQQAFCLQVDTTIPLDKITALYGPTGSGKSTLIRAIAGLDKWKDGLVTYAHTSWQNKTFFMPTYQRNIGVILQNNSLFPHLNVEQNILYGYQRTKQRLTLDELHNYYKKLAIEHLLNAYPKTLSGGELQKVSLIRAMATNPKLLLLDEACSALDENNRQIFLHTLREYQQKHRIAVIFISHQNKDIAQVADYLLVMKKGQIIEQGNYQSLTTNANNVTKYFPECYFILEAEMMNHTHTENSSKEKSLIQITVDKQSLTLPILVKPNIFLQEKCRLLINKRDISLSKTPIEHSSIPYHIEGKIASITEEFAHIKLEKQALLCKINAQIIRNLNLCENQKIYLQINHLDCVLR